MSLSRHALECEGKLENGKPSGKENERLRQDKPLEDGVAALWESIAR
jgi:hypothetical protein